MVSQWFTLNIFIWPNCVGIFRLLDTEQHMEKWNISADDVYYCFCSGYEKYCSNFQINPGKFEYIKDIFDELDLYS